MTSPVKRRSNAKYDIETYRKKGLSNEDAVTYIDITRKQELNGTYQEEPSIVK